MKSGFSNHLFFYIFYSGKDATDEDEGLEGIDEATVDASSEDEIFIRPLSPLVFRHLPDLPSLVHIMT